ncbi:MAG: hypothetical protein WC365_05895 [Candidatus Babeliales bacterium]
MNTGCVIKNFAFLLCLIYLTPVKTNALYAGGATSLPGYNALTQYTAFNDVQQKAAQYKNVKSDLERSAARESISFGALKNQRIALKQQIDQSNADYKNNIQRLKAIAQQRRNEVIAALKVLDTLNPALEKEKAALLADTEKIVNSALSKLDATLSTGDFLPKPITD